MYEVEIKVPAAIDRVRDRLAAIGATQIDARRQQDVYYDAPHRRFAETDEALRIRHETPLVGGLDSAASGDETTKVTYKGPLMDAGSKTRAEHETAVADGAAIAGVFDGLGFEPAATVEKRREFWSYAEFTVTLDRVESVGEFVEIERTVADETAIGSTREQALAALEQFGLDGDDQIRTSYLELLLEGRQDNA